MRHVGQTTFVAMPFEREFDDIYYFGIKGPVEEHGRKCERIDQDHFTGDIVTRIEQRISACGFFIGDITRQNANVLIEVGYAKALQKPIILLSQDKNTPFDLQTQKQIRYKPHAIFKLASDLNTLLDELLPDRE